MGCRFGPLAARAFGVGVACLGLRRLAMPGLAPRRLPTAALALTFGLLAVALIPAPRLVLAPAPFAQTHPGTRSAPTGRTALL